MKNALLIAALAGTMLVAMAHATQSREGTSAAFAYEFEAIEGGKLPLGKWQGKVLLVVNTASFCGYTHQYEGLQTLWERYEKRGLVVIGVPSNDFGGQEPKSETEIASFCQGAFGITFPLTTKETVLAPRRIPSIGGRAKSWVPAARRDGTSTSTWWAVTAN
jgi:glutathione peroxidase